MRYGAVIAAAGLSSRMQAFKPLMKIGGVGIAERVIEHFIRVGAEDIVMVTGYRAEELESALARFPVTFLRNREYAGTEMFDSAKLGLSYLEGRCDRIFFCPGDVPLFTERTLREEMRRMDANAGTAVIIPVWNGRSGHPVLIDGESIPAILSHDGERGLKGAFQSLPEGSVLRVPVEDDGAVLDADTREDYEKLAALCRREF